MAERGRAVVAGATGYLGRFVLEALTADGWRVRALVRDEARLGEARAFCDEVFIGEATRPETLTGLFDKADVAFSSIGIHQLHRRPTYEEVDYGANVTLIDLARASGVARFCYVAVLGGAELRSLSPLVDAKERVVDHLMASGMRPIVVRPTGFFNDMHEIFGMAKRGRVWVVGSGETRINPIHGADLAHEIARLIAADDPAVSSGLGGPDVLSQRAIAELAFQALERPVKISHVPAPLVRAAATAIRPFNPNAAALARMFTALSDHDGVGRTIGTHHLADEFRALATHAG